MSASAAVIKPVSSLALRQKPVVAANPSGLQPRAAAMSVRCAAGPEQPTQHSRRAALAMGAVAGVAAPVLMRASAAASPPPPPGFDGGSSAAAYATARANPIADVAEGDLAARLDDRVPLGMSGLEVTPIGVGAWSWGDRSGYWGNDLTSDSRKAENLEAYKALLGSGIDLIDTAEVYGFGLSEEFVGGFMRETGSRPVIATKFAPLPWRFTSGSVVDACRASASRLGVERIDLYQMHWPAFGPNFFRNDAFVQGLADCVTGGLAKAVGVSNFKADRVATAARILQDNGVALASNQVQYSLLYREPERNGVADAVKAAGGKIIAYSPLCQGLLTGKYNKDNLPGGPRSLILNEDRINAVQPLLSLMRDIGSAHGGKTPGQVAINWTICKGAVPIPGVKNAKQAKEAAGGFGWRMSDDEVAALDAASDKIPESTGAPFEKW